MESMPDSEIVEQNMGPCVLRMNPWRKSRSIFTTPSSLGPNLMSFPMPPPPNGTLPNHPQLRFVRLSPFPHYMRPPFPNSEGYNGYPPHIHRIVNGPSPQKLDDTEFQYESVLNPPKGQPLELKQENFPQSPSSPSPQNKGEEVLLSGSQQGETDIMITDFPQVDSLENGPLIREPQSSRNMTGSVTSTNEVNFPTSTETIYEFRMDPNTGEMIPESDYSNSSQQIHTDNGETTFSSIEEAVATIDSVNFNNVQSPVSTDYHFRDSPSRSDLQADISKNLGMNVTVTGDKQEEVVKAAKSLFSKRTRTLYHWLYPETSKTKLKATVSAAWDTLPENEKHFYISQVLGRFGLQASSLMVNPQLDGIKGLPNDLTAKSMTGLMSQGNTTESQRAVDNLFASCDDADKWASYPKPKRRNSMERCRKRKSTRSSDESGGRARLGAVDPDEMDEEAAILKRMREENLETEFEEDAELTKELEKFRLISQNASNYKDNDDEFWTKTPDPDDLFSHMDL